ncbi:MAG: type I DNA topoisomerase [Bacteroidales bacterium]|nr:type I DNA topoisomerase [Bacteroidales bacterium]
MADNLVIVESPAKAKTIEKYLGENYKVMSSYGHIRDLEKKELGIDIENGFEPNYIVPEDKMKVVRELKAAVKGAKTVWLASDEDREGEAIAWHLFEELNLKKKDNKRIVFNEITKTAILNAVENPREIDINLVNAQQARRVLDRIVGYEISPVLWRKVKPALSAGRVQSVAVRLIVEREEEIKNFVYTYNYRISAVFHTPDGKSLLKAVLNNKFENQDDAYRFLERCKNATFKVSAVEKTPVKRSPAPPFTTSTLQQEASRKLGFSVSQTMMVAQQLYEAGLITYMRTDSVNLSDYALGMAKAIIPDMFGKDYLKIRKYATKSKGAQEAHEAIRPTSLERQAIQGDNYQIKLYNLIWKRMVASQMADAKLEKTTITIEISNDENVFSSQAEVILFDGFLKLYQVSVDEDEANDEELTLIPNIQVGESLLLQECVAKKAYNQRPPRYNEATLVKRLEDLGIGRPSTYAPTITTIQKRDYVEKRSLPAQMREVTTLTLSDNDIVVKQENENFGKETNKLFPTDIGVIVNAFLVNNFSDILSYNFTAEAESHFDKIAQGKEDWHKMLEKFYNPFMQEIKNAKENSEKQKGERLLGTDPKSGKKVVAKIGRYGAMVQIGEAQGDEKPQFASLQPNQSISTITLEEALSLFGLPRSLGQYKDKEVSVNTGRFGAYVKWGDKNVSLPKSFDPYTVNLEDCIAEIEKKIAKDQITKDLPKTVATLNDEPVELKYGRFGLYLSFKEKNYRIPKDTDVAAMSEQEAIDIVSGKKKSSAVAPLREFSSGAQILNGRYGEYIKYNGKNYKMPKGTTSKTITEEEVNKITGK